jgi:hypothetical protein
MSIQVAGLAPYASFIVAHAKSTPADFAKLRTQMKRYLTGSGYTLNTLTGLKGLASTVGSTTFGYHIIESRRVAWAGLNVLVDQLNHLVACVGLGEFALIYVSDSDLKAELHDHLYAGGLSDWEPADQSVLVDAYVKGQSLKALWLGGAHRNVSYRPSSKVLSGSRLQDAIDPFGDSTFVAGAVRTSDAGVSLKRSGLWFRACKDWSAFQTLAHTALTELNTKQAIVATLSPEVHRGLARRLDKFTDVSDAYGVQWADTATIAGKTRGERLDRLSTDYGLEIATHPALASPEQIGLDIAVKATGATHYIIFIPHIEAGRVVLTCATIPSAVQSCVDAILADPTLIRIYYNSGHTIADATLSIATIQDRKFALEYCSFSPPGTAYNITEEKPPGKPVPIADMFSATDTSLFKWVFKDGLAAMGLSQLQTGRCWLYCDDGSGEVADFIHIDLQRTSTAAVPYITLIHVKGANSKKLSRRIAVGPYEVVTAQAMKNLRRMIAGEMLDELKKSVATHGDQRVWDTPWAVNLRSTPGTGAAMLAALATINANCDYEVIVVQPHVRKTTYDANPGQTAARQLRSLLFGAEALTHAAGARFRVICDVS